MYGNACGNALHYGLSMLNLEKVYGNACGNVCGKIFRLCFNALHYGLSMFIELEKFPYSSLIPISVKWSMLPNITKLFGNI